MTKTKYKATEIELHDSNCCGLYNMYTGASTDGYDWRHQRRITPLQFSSLHLYASNIYKQLAEQVYEQFSRVGRIEEGGYLIQTVHISKYRGTDQSELPFLSKALKLLGWKSSVTWINNNTGNELTLYQYYLSKKEIIAMKEMVEAYPD